MALLKHKSSGKTINLRSHHIFGRSRNRVDTFVDGNDISLVHASIRWEGGRWTLMDHSKNGTFINNKRIHPGDSVNLQVGDVISFSQLDYYPWYVSNLGIPSAVLVPLVDNKNLIELSQFHVLPNEENPEISFYKSDKGHWVCEEQDRTYLLDDGSLINVDNTLWQFFDAQEIDGTLDGAGANILPLEVIQFRFIVNREENHIHLFIKVGNRNIDLGERVHHFLLLTLARKRLNDARNGIDASNQGWVSLPTLRSALRTEEAHINILIYRARKQIVRSLSNVLQLPQVVERRAGKLRFGFPGFQIVKGSRIEATMEQGNADMQHA